jgi:alpha-D-xyloside xylohydrolase
LRYQDTMQAIFERRNTRTWGLVRSSHALAAPSPYTLYSDLYDHREFIRALPNAGFCGLLWCPEVRDAKDNEDLIRRLQTVIFSPLAMVNAWYIRNPPWKQVDREANNAGQFAAGWQDMEQTCRKLVELRMQLIPYLYSAYVRYHQSGLPPFRALVMDYPLDPQTWAIDDEYLMGDSVLVAPVVHGEKKRRLYLPEGDWFDFWTSAKISGKQWLDNDVPLDRIPVFIKGGALIPLARVTQHTADPAAFELTVRRYGPGDLLAVLYEDDGSLSGPITTVQLEWRENEDAGSVSRPSNSTSTSYSVTRWERISG